MKSLIKTASIQLVSALAISFTALCINSSATTPVIKDTAAPVIKDTAGPVVGGPCTYTTTSGHAVFTKITSTAAGMEVKFNFLPTSKKQSIDKDVLFEHPSSKVTKTWLKAHHIKVGASLSCKREKIKTGACSPMIYKFPTIKG
jgi:hypothetical protein